MTGINYPNDFDPSFGYDDLGNRTSMTSENGATTFAYDAVGRMTMEVMPIGETVYYGVSVK